jgi:putative (di)nucleoside polyphosphate hydrolase
VIDWREGYRYKFREGAKRKGFVGQEQAYYRCRFLATDSEINIAGKKPEFSNWRWIYPEQFRIEWVPDFKRDVYRQVFADFFNVTL